MANVNDPNLGLAYGYTFGETPWNTGMDENLVLLSGIVPSTVLSATTMTQPSGVDGAVYFVPSGASGAAWSANPDTIAIYEGQVYNQWFFSPIKEGQPLTILDDATPYGIKVWNGSDFVTGDSGYITESMSYTATGDVEFSGRLLFTGTHTSDLDEVSTMGDLKNQNSKFNDILSVSTSRDIEATDAGCLLEVSGNGMDTVELTVQPDATIPIDDKVQITITSISENWVKLVEGSGVTIYSPSHALHLNGKYSGATLVKVGTNTWRLFGDISTPI